MGTPAEPIQYAGEAFRFGRGQFELVCTEGDPRVGKGGSPFIT
jgi:hypothetical protein